MPRRIPVSGEGVTQKLMAELLNVDPRQVRNLEKAGLPFYYNKRNKEKRYPWPESLHWYIRFKQEEVSRRLGTSQRAEEALADKLEAQAGLEQLKLQERRGELLTLDHLDRRVDALLSAVRGVMLSFAGKWAPDLVGCISAVEVRERLENALGDGLAHIESAVITAAETSEEDEDGEEPNEDVADDGAGEPAPNPS